MTTAGNQRLQKLAIFFKMTQNHDWRRYQIENWILTLIIEYFLLYFYNIQ